MESISQPVGLTLGLGVTRVPHTRDARTSPRLTQEVNRQQVLGDG